MLLFSLVSEGALWNISDVLKHTPLSLSADETAVIKDAVGSIVLGKVSLIYLLSSMAWLL